MVTLNREIVIKIYLVHHTNFSFAYISSLEVILANFVTLLL